jgi:hypothetical protein
MVQPRVAIGCRRLCRPSSSSGSRWHGGRDPATSSLQRVLLDAWTIGRHPVAHG